MGEKKSRIILLAVASAVAALIVLGLVVLPEVQSGRFGFGGSAGSQGSEDSEGGPSDSGEQEGSPKGESDLTRKVQMPIGTRDAEDPRDGWDPSVSYSVKEETFKENKSQDSSVYGMRVETDFDITYPQLVNAGPHTDEINERLRKVGMRTVDYLWTNPDSATIRDTKSFKELLVDSVLFDKPEDADVRLCGEARYIITYNTEDFISVFFPQYMDGFSIYGYPFALCVNANLKTGELYVVEDILTIDDQIANRFVDMLERTSPDGVYGKRAGRIVDIGRYEWVRALKGEGPFADSVYSDFFVDDRGYVNLCGVMLMSNPIASQHGYGSVTLSQLELEDTKKDSSFWSLLENAQARS